MDAFFASVEQLDNPSLRGKPVAVGGGNERGVVAAASYEARKYGVRSAMSGKMAARLCPDLIFVKSRHDRYKEISKQIHEIFHRYTDLVEPLSLDEAFLDVTENKKNLPSATLIAQEIRDEIKSELGLNASAGISINKFVAKVASDINKPNGQKLITPLDVIPFLEQLVIDKFFGVGKVTAQKMKSHGIFNGFDLKQKTLQDLVKWFGKAGKHFYHIVRAENNSPVKPNRTRKSVGAERTFGEDISDNKLLKEKLSKIADEIERRLNKANLKGKTVSLKYKYQNFEVHTRSKTVSTYISSRDEFMPIVIELFNQQEFELSLRLIGITISNLNNQKVDFPKEGVQLTLEF
ncbi:MAG: DNA polymerase IV [Flavobacteriales bacterium]|nr:DNA polymerase IV [Flavobacteriales bacterium]